MATIYVDASRPNDSGSGLTTATAKKTFSAAWSAASSGDTISLRAGYCYDPSSGDFPVIQNKNNITIDAYGFPPVDLTVLQNKWDNYPILDALNWENAGAAGWVHEGGGVWSKTVGTTSVERLWVGCSNSGVAISQRVLGTAKRRTASTTASDVASITAALDFNTIWHPSTTSAGKLYVFTGSEFLDPPNYYNGLAYLMTDSTHGAYCNIRVTKCHGTRVSQIHGRAPQQNCFWIYSTPSDTVDTYDNVFDDCLGSCMYRAGFSIRNGTVNTVGPKYIKDCYIRNCVGNTFTSENEQDPSYLTHSYTALLNMYELTGAIYNCHVEDSATYNSGHVSIVVGAGFENLNLPEHCGFKNHYTYWDSWASYGRGMSTNRCGTGCYVIGCTFDGQNVQSQVVDGIIAGNKWVNNRRSIRKPDTEGWVSFEVYATDWGLTAFGDDKFVVSQPKRLIFANNLCIDNQNDYQCLQITTYANGGTVTIPAPEALHHSMLIANNMIIDRLKPTRPWLAAWQNGGTVHNQIIQNNLVYTGTADVPFIKWKGTNYALNAAPGESGTITSNPLLNESTYRVAEGSPAIGAGKFVAYYRDFGGNDFNVPPSIGIYEIEPSMQTRNPRT